jgi:hypothetical protein
MQFCVTKISYMQTITQGSYLHSYRKSHTVTPLWSRFIKWADRQEEHRFGWTAGIIAGHGCIMTVLTTMAIVFTGNHFIFWPFAIGAMAVCLITNLAAMPTKITIPVFFFSLLIDIAIIAICLVNGFNMEATYI